LESVVYYRQLQAFKMMMYAHRAAVGTHMTPASGIRQAWTGTEVLHVAERLLLTVMGLGAPLPGERFTELNNVLE
jgi:hypothetical protein